MEDNNMKDQKLLLQILLIFCVFLNFSSFAALNTTSFPIKLNGITSTECTTTLGHQCYASIKIYLEGRNTENTLIHFYSPDYTDQISPNGIINTPSLLEKTGIKTLHVGGQLVKLDTDSCNFKQGVKAIEINYSKTNNNANCHVNY